MPTINVSKEVKEALVSLQGLLQLKGEHYSLSDVVAYLLSMLPEDAVTVEVAKLRHIKLVEPNKKR
jgi:predicted CopG family antitoxin